MQITRQAASECGADWDPRARENARHYVATGQNEWTDEEFYRSGEQVTMQEDILNDLANICQGKDPKQMKVLEIGCGAGTGDARLGADSSARSTRSISAGEMVRQAAAPWPNFPTRTSSTTTARIFPCCAAVGGSSLRISVRLQLDFAFSFMVFQHIPSREIIENYVREVNRVLRPGALFKFQVQGARMIEASRMIAGLANRSRRTGARNGGTLRLRNAIPVRRWRPILLALVFQERTKP